MEQNIEPLSQLNIGESGIIKYLEESPTSLKLMEMGCLPGEVVTISKSALFGDPIAIKLSDFTLSLRLKEAASIFVEKINSSES